MKKKKLLSLLLLKRIYHTDKIVLPGARSAQKIFIFFLISLLSTCINDILYNKMMMIGTCTEFYFAF